MSEAYTAAREEAENVCTREELNHAEFDSYLPMILDQIDNWTVKESIANDAMHSDIEHAAQIVKHFVIAFIADSAGARSLLLSEMTQGQLLYAQRCAFAILVAMGRFCDTMFKDPFLAEYANARREGRKPSRIVFSRDFRTFSFVSKFVRDLLNEIIDRRFPSNAIA